MRLLSDGAESLSTIAQTLWSPLACSPVGPNDPPPSASRAGYPMNTAPVAAMLKYPSARAEPVSILSTVSPARAHACTTSDADAPNETPSTSSGSMGARC
jgi:hypothetical protein